MYIEEIKLHNFRNYEEQKIELNKNINIFYGENAQGKTNIIESIFLCAYAKSFRTSKDKEIINLNKNEASVTLKYQKKDRKGTIRVNISDKKYIYLNDIKAKKMSEILGNLNVVIFSPDDINILKDGPQKRRRFLDMMIGQLRPNYIHCLNIYLKVLEQRNNYLRQIKEQNKSEDLLEIWDEKLAEYAIIVYRYRYEFINKIKEVINEIHCKITDNKENLELNYISECDNKEKFIELLKQRRKLDIIKGYTTKGVHRDDFNIFINNKEVSVYGSQGQNRTVVLSLKLAELQVIKDDIDDYPILLLDDFMSELDSNRRKSFLNNIENTQVIITCTDPIEIEKFNKNVEYKLYNVKKGEVF